jgi:GR25 family glycosyltransferase involved in LPS biosynthesis
VSGAGRDPRERASDGPRPAGRPTRVKLIGSWCSPQELCREWDRMSQGDGRWNDLEITWEDRDVDFYVIVNRPWPGETYVPERTIVIQMEPWCGEEHQTWGVKTWGEWAEPDEARFLQVRSHRRHVNTAFWQLPLTYSELKTISIRKTRLLSAICGPKYFDPGHIKRVDFLRFLGEKDDDVVRVDVYGPDNRHGFRTYRGPLSLADKDTALVPYRYFFAAENNQERNFITEKLWEPLLTETLCFYWGCPNVDEYVDSRAYIPLDLSDFEGAFQTMRAAILANEWEKRLDVIRREKQKVLEHYQFFATLERVLRRELRLPAHPTDAEVIYHKYFADALDDRVRTVCFIHSLTRGRDTSILEELLDSVERAGLLRVLDRLYVVNVGDEAALPAAHARHADKVRLINHSKDPLLFERPTLDLLRTFCVFHEGAKVLYLHTKGASHEGGVTRFAEWRRYMLHFLVERFLHCLDALERSDVVGCDLMSHSRPHFSGNFWWATARHLSRLAPVPAGSRHEAEWWVLGGTVPTRPTVLHQSGVDHYWATYPRSAYATPVGTDLKASGAAGAIDVPVRTTICLVMIVKDEAHVVCQALGSVLPYIGDYVIVDTGSSDGTPETIRAFLAARGIDGHLFERPWKDFGWNRTEALSLARQSSTSEYLWMLDADDLVEGSPDLAALTADAYHLRFGPDIEYWRLQLFRRTQPWRYVGVLHEYAACDGDAPSLGWVSGTYRVQSRRLGNRSRDPGKYERDAAVLEAALREEPESARHVFYLAQSYFDAGQFEAALAAYRRRIDMGGALGERFYSAYRVALCLEKLDRPFEEVQEAYLECARTYPHRAEPLVRAAADARAAGRWQDAYDLACRAALVPKPGTDALFVDLADYGYRALDEKALAAFHVGRPDESFSLCTQLLEGPNLPDSERARVEENRDLSVPMIKDAMLRYDADLVRRIGAQVRSGPSRVTLTITTCRRLSLFVGTVSSFLNACADLDLVDRWVCVDDGSTEADRAEMQRLFPFFEFVWKGPEDRGHARSLNSIRRLVRTPYLVHLEDDWHFFARRPYIGPAIEILESRLDLGQVLFNRNYAETLADRDIPGGTAMRAPRDGPRYVLHEYHPQGSAGARRFDELHGGPSCAYWPHFSLRPSVLRASVLAHLGPFAEDGPHFEREYAERYVCAGHRSAFFDGVHAVHTGRLTSERGHPAKANAYLLNGEPQFGEQPRPVSVPPAWPLHPRCRVRLVSDGASPSELCGTFARQSMGGGRWAEVELTADAEADYVAILDDPGSDAGLIDPERSIVLQTGWSGPAGSGKRWVPPDARRFVQVRSQDRFPVVGAWRLNRTYTELRHGTLPPKTARLSAVLRAADGTRVMELVRSLEAHATAVDVFGLEGTSKVADGDRTPRTGGEGLFPYRYTIVVEEGADANCVGERLVDALLAECVPFYAGCSNLEDHLDPGAFIRLPLDDLAECRQIIQTAMAQEEWSRRIDVIRREKRRILDEMQLLPTLARVVRGHRLVGRLGIRVINLDRRTDRWQRLQQHVEEATGPSFASRLVRFPAIDGRQITMTPDMAHMFRGNDFGTRRGFVACALSHMALWRELAASDAPGFLILEDDVHLCPEFMGQIVELCGRLETQHPGFDVAFLGHFEWQPRPEDDSATSRLAVRLRAFDGSRYLGGTFAYILSRQGAQQLLTLVERDGVQNGIDRFIHRKAAELELVVAQPYLVTAPHVVRGSGLDSDIQNDHEPCPAPAAVARGGLPPEEPTVARGRAGHRPEDRQWAATLTFEAYGRRIGIRASSGAALELAADRLPPGSTMTPVRDVERWYSLAAEQNQRGWAPIRLEVDGTELFRAPTLHRVLDVLERDLQHHVAEMARDRLFLHAGVIGWRGGAVLLPGRSLSGKTTLVAELVRAGATYYSDEYAVLDEEGRVHPYACRLGVRLARGRHRRVAIESLGVVPGTERLPVRLVVLTSYRETGRWELRRLSPGQGVLSLMTHALAARRIPATALSIIRRALQGVTVLEGERPEATSVAEAILALCPAMRSAPNDHGESG